MTKADEIKAMMKAYKEGADKRMKLAKELLASIDAEEQPKSQGSKSGSC